MDSVRSSVSESVLLVLRASPWHVPPGQMNVAFRGAAGATSGTSASPTKPSTPRIDSNSSLTSPRFPCPRKKQRKQEHCGQCLGRNGGLRGLDLPNIVTDFCKWLESCTICCLAFELSQGGELFRSYHEEGEFTQSWLSSAYISLPALVLAYDDRPNIELSLMQDGSIS
ncbi:hypothetical protein C8Q80DRAFT_184920 [Daedaleopsis nitida]|nr:hypothetical protein C8Q80DRAFT_184920 [Daedaleopsis nitida]